MDTYQALTVATFVLVLISILNGSRGSNAGQLKMIDRKLNLVLDHLGINANPGIDQEIKELLRTGQKIHAIKLYREQTGCGLKDAKDYVEGL